LRHVKGP